MKRKIESISVQELTDGFSFDEKSGKYACLFCDAIFEEGNIYDMDGCLLEAHKAVRSHIENKHGPVFNMLLAEDKRLTGLTDIQKSFLTYFYRGLPDKDIAAATDTSPSTVRYQRFCFREKAKQAKMILALSELLEEKLRRDDYETPQVQEDTAPADEGYMTADAETEKVMIAFFSSFNPLTLSSIPSKQKNKSLILSVIAKQFDTSRIYTEKQVNEIIKAVYFDVESIRRYLIEFGFMGRKPDGSEYWVNEV